MVFIPNIIIKIKHFDILRTKIRQTRSTLATIKIQHINLNNINFFVFYVPNTIQRKEINIGMQPYHLIANGLLNTLMNEISIIS